MYHAPMDMITRMMSVPRETKSLPFHRASRPYGFSTNSLVGWASTPAPGGGVGAGLAASGAGVAAGGGAGAGARASARNGTKPTHPAAANAGAGLVGFNVWFFHYSG